MITCTPDKIRNLVFVGDKGVGKTSFLDVLALVGGITNRQGKVDEGSSFFDTDPQEIKRNMSLNLATASVGWSNHKINLIDTPGFADFSAEAVAGIWASDVVVICIDAIRGVQVNTKWLYDFAREHNKPIVFLITKMDHDNADYQKVISSCKEILGARTALLQLPVGQGSSFEGVVGLFHLKAFISKGGKTQVNDADGEMKEKALAARTEIMDDIAETDEALMAKYLEGETLSDEELHRGLTNGVESGSVVPVVFCSAEIGGGVEAFLQMAVDWLPAPSEMPPLKWIPEGSEETQELKATPEGPPIAQVFKVFSDPGVGEIYCFRVFSGKIGGGETLVNMRSNSQERFGHLIFLQGRERVEIKEVPAGDIGAVAKLKSTTVGDTLVTKKQMLTLPQIPWPQPMVELAVSPKSKADQDKLGLGLSKIAYCKRIMRARGSFLRRRKRGKGVALPPTASRRAPSITGLRRSLRIRFAGRQSRPLTFPPPLSGIYLPPAQHVINGRYSPQAHPQPPKEFANAGGASPLPHNATRCSYQCQAAARWRKLDSGDRFPVT